MKDRMMPWLTLRKYAGFVSMAIALMVFAGCVGGWALKPESAAKESAVAKSPAQGQLADGRQGFIITESSQLDSAGRGDFERAVVMMSAQDYGPAADLLEKIIAQSPGVTAPYINLAIALMHTDRPKQAEEHLKTALGMVPDHPVACNQYGLLCRQAGRFDEARSFYEKALARYPDYYPARRNLGILCDLYLNDLECALAQYEIYSEACPEDQKVGIWIADLRNRIGQ